MRAVLLLVLATGCDGKRSQAAPPSVEAAPSAEMQRCLAWGVAYYREVGSYPTLADGTEADVEVRSKCERQVRAFPDPLIAQTQREIAEIDRQLAGQFHESAQAKGTPREAEMEAAGLAIYRRRQALDAKLRQLRAEAR